MKRIGDAIKKRDEADEKRFAAQSAVVRMQIDGYAAEHAELIDAWKLLDTKAQITIATDGIFIAGVFAVLRGATDDLSKMENTLLVIALVTLMLSVICGIRALELRSTTMPPRGSMFWKPYRELYATEEFGRGGAWLQTRIARFMHDQVNSWNRITSFYIEKLESKATWTRSAQRLLAFGSIAFGGMSLLQILR